VSLSRAVIDAGTEGHYVDGAHYDHTYRSRRHDQRFYVEIARELSASRILELGVGTGRVAIALAREGREVVGVDRMDAMLDRMRARLEREPRAVQRRVRLKRGDMRSVRVGRVFPLVIAPFNVFMHLYERSDVERALRTCRLHLAPRGRLVFDVSMPDVRAFTRDPDRFYKARPVRDPSDGRVYAYSEAFEYDAERQVQLVTSAFAQIPAGVPGGPMVGQSDNAFVRPLAHRQFFPQELEALLHYNGFTLEQRWGDFDRGPLHLDCESQVVVARARARR
jgi:SAM-dependent methyltransferase